MFVQVSICTIHFHLMWAKQIKSTSNLLSYSFSVSLPRVFPCCEFVDCLHDPTGQNDLSWMDVCLFPICSIILQSPKKTAQRCSANMKSYSSGFRPLPLRRRQVINWENSTRRSVPPCSQPTLKVEQRSDLSVSKQIGHQPLQVCYTVNRPATYPTCQDC